MAPPLETRHVCHCGKSFFRKEHLRRHQATHGARSYVCHVCQRAFTRNDLLRRHVGLHKSATIPDSRRGNACDACHENKTKCGGGERCSLCVKRGINCTYDRKAVPNDSTSVTDQSDQPTDASALSSESNGPAVQSPSVVDPPNADLLNTNAVNPLVPESSSAPQVALAEELVWQNTVIERARVGLKALLSAVSPPCSEPKQPRSLNAVEEYSCWLEACHETYFGRIHERWPILQHQIFDARSDPILEVVSAAMIGSWFKDSPCLRECIIDVHNAIVARLLERMADLSPVFSPDKPWPVDVFRALIMNVCFAFETGRCQLISRARVLHGTAISAMRELGIFTSEAIENHEQTFNPGTFIAFLTANREQWKRIVYCSFKLDTYMSLLRLQPPTIHREELTLGLLSTFSTWNAHGLDVFFRRMPRNEYERPKINMSDLSGNSMSFLPPGLMVEDVEIGLCGMWHPLWTLTQSRGATPAPVDKPFRAHGCHQLGMWKLQLDKFSDSIEAPDNPARVECLNTLLRTYSGKEDPGVDGWEQPVLHRIACFIFNGKMLYYLLSLNLLTDVHILMNVAFGSPERNSRQPVSFHLDQQAWIAEWVQLRNTRKVVMLSLFALGAYEQALSIGQARNESLNPVAHVAFSTSAAVLWTWLSSPIAGCDRLLEAQPIPVNMDLSTGQVTPQVESWIEEGGSIEVNGVPVCACGRALWMARVTTALTRAGQVWELSKSHAGILGSKLEELRLADAVVKTTLTMVPS